MDSATRHWEVDYLARAVNTVLLRGRYVNQAALIATGSATEEDVRRMLQFWLVQRAMPVQLEHRLPATVRAELNARSAVTSETCGCDREPPSDQELRAV